MESLSFRFLDSSHFHDVASLFSLVFSKHVRSSDFDWKYRQDLFGRCYGVQAVTETGQVVAHVAAVPAEGVFSGQSMPLFQFVDAMVHPEWRGRNTLTHMIHLLLGLIKSYHPCFFPYVFPGPVSSRIGQKYGWLKLIKSVEDVVITPCSKGWFASKLSFISFERFKNIPSVVNSLWIKLQRAYPILVKRNEQFLSWRYVHHPWFSYEFYLVKRFWKPIGWIIVESAANNPPRIVDYLLPPLEARAIFENFLRELSFSEAIVWLPEVLKQQMIFNPKAVIFRPTPIDLCMVTNEGLDWLPPAEILSATFFYNMGDIDIY
ncbi:MAG: GNAT family N-acetyltransferase [Thermodesulforhabdaceae bacterium]